MTFERRVVVGFDELRAVIFECKCKARTTIGIEELVELPDGCNACRAPWKTKIINDYVQTIGPAESTLVNAITRLRVLIKENRCPVKILLEFNEPKE